MADTDRTLDTLSSPALRSATRAVLSEAAALAAERGLDVGSVRRCIRSLSLVLDADGEVPPEPDSGETAPAYFLLLLLHRFRLTLLGLDTSRPGVDADDVLRLLRAVERLRSGIDPEPSDDPSAGLLAVARGPELVAELAHDLRSPLTSILFLAETLRTGNGGELSEVQRRQLGIIYSAAMSLVSMVSDVIEFARGGASLEGQRPTSFSVSRLVTSIRDLLQPMIEEKDVTVQLVAPDVDQRLGHPTVLSRVLLNLTTNAIRYTERGEIEISARDAGDGRVTFAVRDSGTGIDPDAAATLFQPLRYRAAHQRVGFSGTGLGLSICRKLVTTLGGDLSFDTAQGEGTTFYFTVHLPPAER